MHLFLQILNLKKRRTLPLSKEVLRVSREQDVVLLRNQVKAQAIKIKILTAASELVRNLLRYGGGGEVSIEIVTRGRNQGVHLVFSDKGPGIPDIDKAMTDGFSTGKSLGLGLPGTKRLVNEFEIKSQPGVGTIVSIIKYANG
jgi:serine/threonine-protein kinase RsbT